jgi:lipopolysaccharide export LptBFGC system permease protein LptF
MVSNELPQLKKRQKRFMVDATASVVENLQPGRTSIQLGDFLLKADYRHAQTGTFYNAYVRYLDDGDDEERLVDVFAAEVDIWIENDFLRLRAFDLEAFDPETGRSQQLEQIEADINIAARIEDRKEQRYDRAKYLVSSEIRERLANGDYEKSREREYHYMLHYRASMFAIFFVFLLLGASTGLLMRRGTQLGALAVAAGYGILYYVFSMRLGKELGISSSLPPWIGAWLTTILGGGIAGFLVRRAIRR